MSSSAQYQTLGLPFPGGEGPNEHGRRWRSSASAVVHAKYWGEGKSGYTAPAAGRASSAIQRNPTYSLQPTAYSLRRSRPGISLLEVLISMFVLLFGLMGVAAIFPVGSHYASRGEQFERGAALADAAFADLQARGVLQTDAWIYGDIISGTDYRVMKSGQFSWLQPESPGLTQGPGAVFVIDPMGIASAAAQNSTAGSTYLDIFPYSYLSASNPTGESTTPPSSNSSMPSGANGDANWKVGTYGGSNFQRWPIRRVTLPGANPLLPTLTAAAAETICRLRDDLATDLPTESDHPGIERWLTIDPNNTPDVPRDDIPISRQYTGSYSWLATVVPTTPAGVNSLQPMHTFHASELYEVSVAVFHKRDLPPSPKSERSITAVLNFGGELVFYATDSQSGVDAVDNALKDIHSGDWIALAGMHPEAATQTYPQLLLKWYRLLSLDDETQMNQPLMAGTSGATFAVRRAMVDGPDWPVPQGSTATTIPNLRAIILPGIIGVSTHILPMEDRSRTGVTEGIDAKNGNNLLR